MVFSTLAGETGAGGIIGRCSGVQGKRGQMLLWRDCGVLQNIMASMAKPLYSSEDVLEIDASYHRDNSEDGRLGVNSDRSHSINDMYLISMP